MGEENIYRVVAADEKAFEGCWASPPSLGRNADLSPWSPLLGGDLPACGGGLQGSSLTWFLLFDLFRRLGILGRAQGSWEAMLSLDRTKGEWLARGRIWDKEPLKDFQECGPALPWVSTF